jgi:hypothetical protein
MARYKLKEKCGAHEEGGKTYAPGDIVESPVDLAATFPHKFERASAIQPVDATADVPLQVREVLAPPTDGPATSPVVDADSPADDTDAADGPATGPAAPAGPADASVLAAIKSKLGSNVTAEFSTAVANGYLVLRRGTKYRVADSAEPDNALSGKGKTRAAVVEWLEENTGQD